MGTIASTLCGVFYHVLNPYMCIFWWLEGGRACIRVLTYIAKVSRIKWCHLEIEHNVGSMILSSGRNI